MTTRQQTIAVVTGTRAEYGLLKPVLRAIEESATLEYQLIVAGVHLLDSVGTMQEIEVAHPIAARVQMQRNGDTTRASDATAFARGAMGFAQALAQLKPDSVLVLGDRIEAFAAGSVASIAGIPLAHVHGGDRAAGVADEAMRHAITKLAHLHFPASAESQDRIIRMGEPASTVHMTGSPALDGLSQITPLSDAECGALGNPDAVLLLHPTGGSESIEAGWTESVCRALNQRGMTPLVLAPNLDPGSDAVQAILKNRASEYNWPMQDHLSRDLFIGLLKTLSTTGGVLIGNSSSGLIEASALQIPVINVGYRQYGRQRWAGVYDVPTFTDIPQTTERVEHAIERALKADRTGWQSPFGNGDASQRIVAVLERTDFHDEGLVRKTIQY